MAVLSFLDRERTIARPGFSRWLVPPAALAIHLSIGQVYAFSVFNKPLNKLVAVSQAAPGDTLLQLSQSRLVDALPVVSGEWSIPAIGWVFSIAIVFLGVSAALFGRWLERVGPRKAMFVAACCFGAGFILGSLGIRTHEYWLLMLGYGVLGGTGLGIGYISPVSTLIKWFPDRPGMATGLAIMGFGGGAMIAAPLAVALMTHFHRAQPGTLGVSQTFLTLGILYFIFMMFGVATVRLPADGWRPAGWTPPAVPKKMITTADVDVNRASVTPQFWLLWIMLCLNVTAGIGVISQASPMAQEMFPGRITAVVAGGFVGLLSIANMSGRFLWSTFSDYIGRKATYFTFFSLGTLLYIAVPATGRIHSVTLFVICVFIILTMYGGGFATIPAYLKDMFGTMHVGAIHGRLLTAWSAAGILGPALIDYIREYELSHGVATAHAYDVTMYVMASLLVIGFIANLVVRPVNPKYHYLGAPDIEARSAEPLASR